jgi:hypothetical protein
MRSLFWLGLAGLVLTSAPAWSQAGQQRPPDLTVAPNAPNDQTETRASQNADGRPANICKELVSFLEQQAAKKAEAAAKQGASSQGAQASAPGGANPSTGQTAPAVDKAQHSSGQTAPIPNDDKGSDAANMSVEQARALVGSNDLRGCQDAARRMRKAGMQLPPGLLALAALRQDLLERGQAE